MVEDVAPVKVQLCIARCELETQLDLGLGELEGLVGLGTIGLGTGHLGERDGPILHGTQGVGLDLGGATVVLASLLQELRGDRVRGDELAVMQARVAPVVAEVDVGRASLVSESVLFARRLEQLGGGGRVLGLERALGLHVAPEVVGKVVARIDEQRLLELGLGEAVELAGLVGVVGAVCSVRERQAPVVQRAVVVGLLGERRLEARVGELVQALGAELDLRGLERQRRALGKVNVMDALLDGVQVLEVGVVQQRLRGAGAMVHKVLDRVELGTERHAAQILQALEQRKHVDLVAQVEARRALLERQGVEQEALEHRVAQTRGPVGGTARSTVEQQVEELDDHVAVRLLVARAHAAHARAQNVLAHSRHHLGHDEPIDLGPREVRADQRQIAHVDTARVQHMHQVAELVSQLRLGREGIAAVVPIEPIGKLRHGLLLEPTRGLAHGLVVLVNVLNVPA